MACKIVHVPTGAEVVNYVKMLAEHFDSIGSPVMIGIHVLKHENSTVFHSLCEQVEMWTVHQRPSLEF